MLDAEHARLHLHSLVHRQRFCAENKLKVAKLGNIFFTRVDASTANGLPGACSTIFPLVSPVSPKTAVHLATPPLSIAAAPAMRAGFMLTVADAASSSSLPPVQLSVHGPPRIQASRGLLSLPVRTRSHLGL